MDAEFRVTRMLVEDFGVAPHRIEPDALLHELSLHTVAVEELRVLAEELFGLDLDRACITPRDTVGRLVDIIETGTVSPGAPSGPSPEPGVGRKCAGAANAPASPRVEPGHVLLGPPRAHHEILEGTKAGVPGRWAGPRGALRAGVSTVCLAALSGLALRFVLRKRRQPIPRR